MFKYYSKFDEMEHSHVLHYIYHSNIAFHNVYISHPLCKQVHLNDSSYVGLQDEKLQFKHLPLRTYNAWNNLTYTLHTPLKHRILHANTLLKSIIRCLFILIKSKILLTCFLLYLLAYMLDQINQQTLHLFNSSYL